MEFIRIARSEEERKRILEEYKKLGKILKLRTEEEEEEKGEIG